MSEILLETVISTIILIQFKASEFLKTLLLNTENTKRGGKKEKKEICGKSKTQKEKKTKGKDIKINIIFRLWWYQLSKAAATL